MRVEVREAQPADAACIHGLIKVNMLFIPLYQCLI